MICEYTTSNTDAFSFGHVYMGAERIDSLAPLFLNFEWMDELSFELHFNEALDSTVIEPGHLAFLANDVSIDSVKKSNYLWQEKQLLKLIVVIH